MATTNNILPYFVWFVAEKASEIGMFLSGRTSASLDRIIPRRFTYRDGEKMLYGKRKTFLVELWTPGGVYVNATILSPKVRQLERDWIITKIRFKWTEILDLFTKRKITVEIESETLKDLLALCTHQNLSSENRLEELEYYFDKLSELINESDENRLEEIAGARSDLPEQFKMEFEQENTRTE